MGIIVTYAVLFYIVFTIPTILSFSPTLYAHMALAHFLGFLAAVVLFVMLGRSLRKRNIPRFWPGLIAGAITAFAGTLTSQYILHLPMAKDAFVSQLHGVPRSAALSMLGLHVIASTVLTGLIAAGFYGLLGGFASWWGGRRKFGVSGEDNPNQKNSQVS